MIAINEDTPNDQSLWEVTWFTLLFDSSNTRIQQVHPERTLLTPDRLTGAVGTVQRSFSSAGPTPTTRSRIREKDTAHAH